MDKRIVLLEQAQRLNEMVYSTMMVPPPEQFFGVTVKATDGSERIVRVKARTMQEAKAKVRRMLTSGS